MYDSYPTSVASRTSRNTHRSGLIAVKLLVVFICLVATIPVANLALTENFPQVPETGFTYAERGPMELVITTNGEIDSAHNAVLTNHCEWKTRILSLVPEGTWVEEGDVVAELDSSMIRERFQERAVLLVNARAKLADAQEDLRIQKLNNQSLIAEARLQRDLSKLQYDGYLNAEYPQQLHKLESALALAEEEMIRSRKVYDYVSEMVQRGYRTVDDREQEKIRVMRTEQAFRLAQDRLSVLRDFTFERTSTQLKAIAEEAARELERVELAAKRAMLTREISLQSRQRSHDIYQAYQERLEKNIAACTIRATRSGEVIYGRERSSSRDRLGEGSSVYYLQSIATIPDRDRLQVDLRVHESNVRFIREGLPAVVEVDAYGDQLIRGTVASLSRVPLPGRYPNYHLREYRVSVDLDVAPELARELAPGLTAKVNIIADRRQSTVHVPMQSVVEVGGDFFVFARSGESVEPRAVQIGISDEDSIEIVDGLDEGEEIVFKPRVTCAQRILALQHEAAQSHPGDWMTVSAD